MGFAGRFVRVAGFWLVVTAMGTACSMMQPGQPAEERLAAALDAMRQQQGMEYSVSVERKIGDIKVLSDETSQGETWWTPEDIVAFVEQSDKQVEWVPTTDGNGQMELQVTIAPAAWKQRMESMLNDQLNDLEKQGETLLESRRAELTAEEAAAMEQEWNASLERARQQAGQLLETLSADGTCTIRIDRSTNLPSELDLDYSLQYSVDGQEQEERTVLRYTFERRQANP